MSELAAVFDMLGQTVIPQIAATVFPDTANIVQLKTPTSDGAGGQRKGSIKTVYEGVPCSYEPAQRHESRDTINGKMTSQQAYIVTIATHQDGTRIDLDPVLHRIEVLARGNEPPKTFRITSNRDSAGVCFELNCIKEN
jgi:hypothetical protein